MGVMEVHMCIISIEDVQPHHEEEKTQMNDSISYLQEYLDSQEDQEYPAGDHNEGE